MGRVQRFASVAVIIMLATGLSACGPGSRHRSAAPSISTDPAPPAYAHGTWRVVSIATGGQTTRLSTNWTVEIRFDDDGGLSVFDPVNASTGRLRFTDSGFVVTDVATTAAGYVTLDHEQTVAIGAMYALMGVTANATTSGNTTASGSSETTAVLTDGRLVLTAADYTLLATPE